MEKTYVQEVDGTYRIANSRVSLDSVVYDFLSGLSPESIADNYDTLTLEHIYGAITFYLAHRPEVDAKIQQNRAQFDVLRQKARETHPLLYEKLDEVQEVQL